MKSALVLAVTLSSFLALAPAAAQVVGDGDFDGDKGIEVTIVTRGADGTWSVPDTFWHAYQLLSMEGCEPDEAMWRIWWMYKNDHIEGEIVAGDILVEIPGSKFKIVGAVGDAVRVAANGWVYEDRCGLPPVQAVDVQSVARSLVPETVVRFNPSARGLTGLDTWLWYDPGTDGWQEDDGHITASVTLDGYETNAEAWLRGLTWDLGNGDSISYTIPGTELGPLSPAAYAAAVADEEDAPRSYMYETIGDYPVTLTAVWVGQYWFTDDTGDVAGPFPLGTVDFSDSLLYNVIEVRSVLVD